MTTCRFTCCTVCELQTALYGLDQIAAVTHVGMESAEYENRFSGSEACNSEHDDSATEAAEDSQDEEADKRQFGIYQCLPVDDAEPDWDSGEP